MLAFVNGLLYCNASDYDANTYIKKCKLENKNRGKMERMGYYAQPYYKYYIQEKTGKIFFPKGISSMAKHSNMDFYDDAILDDVKLSLRDYQQQIIDDLGESNLIVAPTGSGKSFIISGMINKWKCKTIIIAPGIEIARGLYEKLSEIYGDRVCSWKKGMKQTEISVIVGRTFNMNWKDLECDMLIVDEAHEGVMGKDRIQAFCKMPFKYFYGLTATDERDDITSQGFEMIYGPKLKADVEVHKPLIKTYRFNKKVDMWLDHQDHLRILYEDEERTQKMAELVIREMKGREMGIVFTGNIKFAESMSEEINKQGLYAMPYTGKTNPKVRKQILDDIHKNHGVMVCTYQTAGTGFDYPPLSTGFYYIPDLHFKGRVKQAVGRILRNYDGKETPVLIDCYDLTMTKQFRDRKSTYKTTYGDVNLTECGDL